MIVVGTWSLSGDYGYKSVSEVEKVLRYAYDVCNIKEYDTAPNYGNGLSEFLLGNIFNNNDNILINTKVGNIPFIGKEFNLIELNKSFYQSLYRLKRDSVNILWVHNPRHEITDYSRIIEWSNKLKEQGLINKIGISLAKNYNYEKSDLDKFDEIQVDCNLFDMEVLRAPQSSHQSIHARSPLYSGVLSGNIRDVSKFEKQDHRSSWLTQKRLEKYNLHISKLEQLTDMEIMSLARRFLFSQSKIKRVICGVKTIAHIDNLIKDLKSEKLNYNLMLKVNEYYSNYIDVK